MWWIRYRSTGPRQAQDLRRALSMGGVKIVVIEDTYTTLAVIRSDHVNGPWWRKFNRTHNQTNPEIVSKDVGAVIYIEVPCSRLTIPKIAKRHASHCRGCKRLASNAEAASQTTAPRPASHLERVKAVEIKTPAPEPVVPSLNGMAGTLKERRDEALAIAADLDSIVVALTNLGEMSARFEALKAEQETGRKALAKMVESLTTG